MVRFKFVVLLIYTACANATIILRCCSEGKALVAINICENYSGRWTPVVYSPARASLLSPPGTIPENFKFVDGSPNCSSPTYFPDSSSAVLIEESGSLFLNELIQLPPETFCISPIGILGCLTAEHLEMKKKTEKKVRKCCPTDAMYSDKSHSCVTNKTNFLSEDTYIHSGFPNCEIPEYAITGKLDDEYSLNADGTLTTKNRSSVTNYCVEYILEHPNEKASIFMCAPTYKTDQHDIRFTIYPMAFFLSIFFLTLTLISSFMLPSSYHALHWKCQTHYVACLLVGDLLLAITQLGGDTISKNSLSCVGIATAMHFFFLAAFFWLNTMCFNIWGTFRYFRPTSLDKDEETYRLVLYELYAWGGPLIIVSVGAIMDHVLMDSYPTMLRPKFGHVRCWFHGDMELFVYFFGPIGILLLVNLILFAATTRELTCGLWKGEVVKSSTERERTGLSHICLRLVIIMGITWIVDLLSWAIGGPTYVWFLTDLVNALQGVFIFIVVGCQPQVWSAVKRMWCLNDSPSRNGGRSYSSNATPSIINDQSSTKPVDTLC